MEFDVKVTASIDIGRMFTKVKNRQGLKNGIQEAGRFVRRFVMIYPPTRTKKNKHLTRAQKRAIFAKLKAGKIVIPYQRGTSPDSQQMRSRWKVINENSGLTARVNNNATYAQYLHGNEGKQSWYHSGNWKRAKQITYKVRPKVRQIVERHIQKDIKL